MPQPKHNNPAETMKVIAELGAEHFGLATLNKSSEENSSLIIPETINEKLQVGYKEIAEKVTNVDKVVLGTLGITGVDILADGVLDAIPTIAAGLGISVPIVAATAGLIMAGTSSVAIVQDINRLKRTELSSAQNAIIAIQSQIKTKYLESYDEAMQAIRDNIKESNESCEDKVEKLPKSSSISRIVEKEQTKVIDLINKIAKDSKSEEYLRAIVEYLKKQYSFSDKRTLCLVLDEIQQKNNMVFNEITPIKSFVETNNIEANLNSLINYIKEQCSFDEDKSLCYFLEQFSNATKERIATIIANQESFVEKYDSIEKVLGDYKDNILVQISANNNSLECIKEQLRKNQQAIKNNGDSIAVVIDKSNDGVEKLNFIQESIDSVSQKTDYVTIMLNSVKDNIGPDSEILGLLSSMNSCIGNEEDNSESDWSIKKNFCDINKKIEELLRKIELQDEMIRTFGEKYKYLEKSQNNMLKMIVVGELISVISVITLIMMQIF